MTANLCDYSAHMIYLSKSPRTGPNNTGGGGERPNLNPEVTVYDKYANMAFLFLILPK